MVVQKGGNAMPTSRAVGTRKWIWGDKRLGYSTIYTGTRKREPFQVEIWLKNRIVRTDNFATAQVAGAYARNRKRKHYGSMTPAEARKAYL